MSTNAQDIRLTYGIPLAAEFESKMKDTELFNFEMNLIARAFTNATSRFVKVKLKQSMSKRTSELLGDWGYQISNYDFLIYQITPKAPYES
jgi:hypothetical protein